MTEVIPEIRNAARALIVRRGKILLLRKEGGGRGERFALPGGAQNTGETLKAALDRECREEIGTSVDIGDLIHVVDYFKLRDTQPPTQRHLVEFLFQCAIPDDYSPHSGYHPDKHQVGVLWIALDLLAGLPLFPQYLSTCIPHNADRALYLGTFHDNAAS